LKIDFPRLYEAKFRPVPSKFDDWSYTEDDLTKIENKSNYIDTKPVSSGLSSLLNKSSNTKDNTFLEIRQCVPSKWPVADIVRQNINPY